MMKDIDLFYSVAFRSAVLMVHKDIDGYKCVDQQVNEAIVDRITYEYPSGEQLINSRGKNYILKLTEVV